MQAIESASADPVLLRRDGAVAVLQLNRPAAFNALDVPTAKAFLAACQRLEEAGDVRAIVLAGAGRSFGVGGDLAAMREDAAGVAAQLIDSLHAAVQILEALDAPVIASLQGAVAGGSMSLALSADLAIAAENASFNLAYTRIGASCDLSSSWHLPRLVGLRRAMEIALLSETIDAAEALRLGLVNRVVAADRLEEETMISRIASPKGRRSPTAASSGFCAARSRATSPASSTPSARPSAPAPARAISPRAWPRSSAGGSLRSKAAEPARLSFLAGRVPPRPARLRRGHVEVNHVEKPHPRRRARAARDPGARRLHPVLRAPPIRRWSSASSMSARSARPAGPISTSSAGAPSSVPSGRG